MDDEDQTAEQFLTDQGNISVDSIDQFEEFFKSDGDGPLRASSSVRSAAWDEMQQARTEYLKEWEEDMRFAQELANEGMHG